MTNTAIKNSNAIALQAVQARFVRVPSQNSYPRFRDLITGIDQGDGGIVAHYYKQQGGSEHDAAYLLGCLPWAYGEGFQPNAGPVLAGGLINLWKAPAIQPTGQKVTRAQVAPFIEFLKRWFPDDLERQYFGWWLSHAVRKPEQRIIATPVLRSQHGVGKGFLVETLLSGLLGRSSVCVCALKDVVGDFNDVIEGKTLALIDEVYKSKKSTTDSLKAFQGNATIPLHRKHKPTVTIDNYLNFIITSNDHLPLVLEKGDRRFWIPGFIRHKHSVQETAEFINGRLKPWLINGGGMQLVRDFIEQIDLSKHQATDAPPMTISKQELMGFSSADKLEELLTEMVENNMVLTVKSIKDSFSSEFDHSLTDMAVAGVLLAVGCKQRRTKHQRYYITPLGFENGLSAESTAKDLEDKLAKRLF
ncbi:primase-helicase family protein [Pseudomonas sp. FYR_7]|uniref:primase-helicase family protein n=1 Tax=Pseudomonas sp. FYR_7 TaxID=3367174 RepID=UPI00370C1C30